MPPRKAPPASPAARNVAASPARSTRNARSHKGRDDDDWESESVQSSFKVPASRGGRGSSVMGLKDTSVNVAAAFHAAQNGNLPTPVSDRGFPSARSSRPPSKSPNPPPPNATRAKSPAEQLAASARALSPVRFFLRSTDDGDGEYTSFSSMGSGVKSTDTSNDYRQEEEYVKAAQAEKHRMNDAAGGKRRMSDVNGRKKKSRAEDMPYRPGEDDWTPGSDDSDGEGEGIVRGGALDGRANTRGTRRDKGEGYLGMGLGIQQRQRRKGRKSGEGVGGDEDDDEFDDDSRQMEQSPAPPVEIKQLNGHAARYQRSPAPASVIARALTPLVQDRRSPAPASRKRRPSPLRTVITNILHGLVLCLRFVVELLGTVLSGTFVQPLRYLFGSGRYMLRRAKANWWKWLGAILALSLTLRLLDRPWRSRGSFAMPDVPPGSMEELVNRLAHLEQAVSLLSGSSKLLTDAEKVGKTVDESLRSRVEEIEGSLVSEQKRLDNLWIDGNKGVDRLEASFSSLKSGLEDLVGRVRKSEQSIKEVKAKVDSVDSMGAEVQALSQRVDAAEHDVKSALDDGRLRAALETILPENMPVKINRGGTVDIDPVFWTEMRKVLAGKGEVESMIRSALGGTFSTGPGKSDKELEEWGERMFARKTSEGVIFTRSDFLQSLEAEVGNLKHIIETLPRNVPSPGKTKPSQVTIKSAKGDDVTSLLQDLIDAALLRYSKDTIARPDYALFTAGARVIPSITSDTLIMRSPGAFGRLLLGKKDIEGRSPATALHPDNSVGSCWPFNGDKGQLGVLLNRRVVVTDVTIEHAASDVALDVSTAPKEVEVWGLTEGKVNRSKVAAYLADHPQNSSIPPSPDHLLLGAFTYEPSAPSHIQTFPVEPEIVDLGVDLGIVIFRVGSNWGGDFTCLYRVRVHGETVE